MKTVLKSLPIAARTRSPVLAASKKSAASVEVAMSRNSSSMTQCTVSLKINLYKESYDNCDKDASQQRDV